MNENEQLEVLLKTISEDQCIGLGNPNAKILFIGKEAGVEIGTEMFHGSAKSWKAKEFNYSRRYNPKEAKLRNLNHTWQRYQKLHDCILSKLNIEVSKEDKYEINFIENIFTTELSNLPAPNTRDAKKQQMFKEQLKIRKVDFFRSEFIQQFPVVVIFASDNEYIETYQGEVCKLFDVKFEGLHNDQSKDKIWIHSENGGHPKLLIHTRQLTNRITAELIPNISDLIVKFIKANSIQIGIN